MSARGIILGLSAVALLASGDAGGQRRNASATSRALIYVNEAVGLDSNTGSEFHPLKTISQAITLAMANAQEGRSTTITVAPGTYRESLPLVQDWRRGVAITLKAAKPGATTISGSDIWDGWQPVNGASRIFTHKWPFRWGLCDLPPKWPNLAANVRHREMVFVNGAPLTQVLSRADLREGSFYVDEDEQRVYIEPSRNVKMESAVIEVATRPKLLVTFNVSDVAVTGFVFEHASTCPDAAAVMFTGGSNIKIEDSSARWNNWHGFALANASMVEARNLIAQHNGASGLSAYELKSAVLEDITTSENNWRGASGGFTSVAMAGAKLMRIHGGILRRIRAVSNQTHGIWFDFDNRDINAKDIVSSGNLLNGIFLEANQGPIDITNSRVCGNGLNGVLIANTQNSSLQSTIDLGNAKSQLMVGGDPGDRPVTDWETGQVYQLASTNWSMVGNTVAGKEAEQLALATTLPSSDWARFADTLKSDRNNWFNPARTHLFRGPGETLLDFQGWRAATGQDAHSRFAAPAAEVLRLCGSR